MFTVYILKSLTDQKRYIGLTENLERRLNDHNSGLVKSTKNKRPLKLIHSEQFQSKSEALKRERFFKTGFGRSLLTKVGK
jgi:putative endonuclease